MDPRNDDPAHDEDRKLTAAERLAWRRNAVLAGDDALDPDTFPTMKNLSAAFMYDAVIRPDETSAPEFATLTLDPGLGSEENTKTPSPSPSWNILWEAGQFRRRMFDFDDLPQTWPTSPTSVTSTSPSCPAPAPGTSSTRHCSTSSPPGPSSASASPY